MTATLAGLSDREVEVLRLLAKGHNRDQIAHDLVVTPNTIRTHIQNILGKLAVRSQVQAVVWAFRNGLANPDPTHVPPPATRLRCPQCGHQLLVLGVQDNKP
jgi:DNA-binding CsgD family transcriptional regulator